MRRVTGLIQVNSAAMRRYTIELRWFGALPSLQGTIVRIYYFDTKDGVPVRDGAGSQFASPAAAIAHSKHLAAAIRDKKQIGDRDLHIVVVEESGREIHREPVYPMGD
jgi:uncharacterized protein DUF6894